MRWNKSKIVRKKFFFFLNETGKVNKKTKKLNLKKIIYIYIYIYIYSFK